MYAIDSNPFNISSVFIDTRLNFSFIVGGQEASVLVRLQNVLYVF